MLRKQILSVFFVSFIFASTFAEVKLPAVINNNMVLQQQSSVPLWGKASANKTVRITTSWDRKNYKAVSDNNGEWRVNVKTPAAGGPYTITFDDGQKVQLNNILIGEVWVCSGQSNMVMPLKGYRNQPTLNGNDIAANAANPNIRLFHLQRAVSNVPLDDCKGSWEVSSPESAVDFSAIGFQFAQQLQKILNVPIGVIESDWGGTPIEAWMDKASLEPFPGVKIPTANDAVKAEAHRPTCLFNAMIAPITGYGIKGFLWYQGENNASKPTGYDQLMASMVSGWRKLWNTSDTLSFYYVQIAPYRYPTNRDSIAVLREMQQIAQSEIPNSGMAVSIDAGNEFTIHPGKKTVISKRLLYWALGDAYHQKGIAYKSPYYQSMEIKNGSAVISLTDAPNGFTSWDKEIEGFEIAGSNKSFYPAEAKIVGTTIQVQSDKVPTPVSVRYGFKDWAPGNLYSTEGLPVAPFRTDDW